MRILPRNDRYIVQETIGRKTSEYKYELAPTETDQPTKEPSNVCHHY